jgi:hypothetical protein
MNKLSAREVAIMALVDEYADAFHAAMRPDGGIQFGDGLVAKAKKDAIREALRVTIPPEPAAVPEGWTLVPVEIDRATCKPMLSVWNHCMEEAETLEMAWPLLVAAAPKPETKKETKS